MTVHTANNGIIMMKYEKLLSNARIKKLGIKRRDLEVFFSRNPDYDQHSVDRLLNAVIFGTDAHFPISRKILEDLRKINIELDAWHSLIKRYEDAGDDISIFLMHPKNPYENMGKTVH